MLLLSSLALGAARRAPAKTCSTGVAEEEPTEGVFIRDKARQDPFRDRIMDESLLVNQYPTEKLLMFKKQADEGGHCSLVATHMTPEMFERY
jgi:hypothetical protein